jgi:FixJ family two-component response regulator
MGNWASAGSTKPTGTVLVVDDDVSILELTGKMLRLAGYRVLETNIPSEADLIFERNTAEIDLLVSDVQMPSLTGPELAIRLWQRNPRLPVVFMSACADNSGPPGTLQKPFRMADLWSKVSEALNGVSVNPSADNARKTKPDA